MEGAESLAGPFKKLMTNIDEKKTRLIAPSHEQPHASLGEFMAGVEASLIELENDDVIARIWRKDYTVWKPDPREISNRLGWLDVTDQMREQVPALEALAREVRDAGTKHVVVLGMGGSSLGPEVLRQTFGSAAGYPELIVLDSTVPDRVREVSETVDPTRSLFLVSSKSGTTLEPRVLYRHFRRLVECAVGDSEAGKCFMAITDPRTPLIQLAQDEGFRRVLLNPPDMGGRYSVLSYFGLVPAVLLGTDVNRLLDRADCMRERCASSIPACDNPGAFLGAAIGALALQGRDKLTFVTSPSVASFGLWTEQLIAESTGKEGRGIVPIAGEPLMSINSYGNDRVFVYLRVDTDDNERLDAAMEKLWSSGHPVMWLTLRDKYDLGAEFFRWEFATAVAGAILSIQPFDQPNVQSAKDQTARVLEEYQSSGKLPDPGSTASVEELLSLTKEGDYLSIMVYVRQTPGMDQTLADLRHVVTTRYHIATTLGYGPRFLHSTGQLHKGGPSTGLYLQITADASQDVGIPDEAFTFDALTKAQALGDLRALKALGRRSARLHLGSREGEAVIRRLSHKLAKAEGAGDFPASGTMQYVV